MSETALDPKRDCVIKDGLITPCEALANTTSDYQGHYKKGMSIMPITQLVDKPEGGKDFKHVKDYLIVKNGKYQKNGIVCHFCPFCGKTVYQKAEAEA